MQTCVSACRFYIERNYNSLLLCNSLLCSQLLAHDSHWKYLLNKWIMNFWHLSLSFKKTPWTSFHVLCPMLVMAAQCSREVCSTILPEPHCQTLGCLHIFNIWSHCTYILAHSCDYFCRQLWRQNNTPKDAHMLILKTCEFVTTCGKR